MLERDFTVVGLAHCNWKNTNAFYESFMVVIDFAESFIGKQDVFQFAQAEIDSRNDRKLEALEEQKFLV